MRLLGTTLLASAIAAASLVTSVQKAVAMPVFSPHVKTSEVERVQYRRHGGYDRRHGWHNGHRGFRDRRDGYRRHSDGYWYPLAALGAGALIGGAIASQPRRVEAGINPRHYDWCSSRYQTYRASDNTYVPQVGYRAACQSPYY